MTELHLSTQVFTGPPSNFSTAQVVMSADLRCVVVFAVSGEGQAAVAQTWQQKITEASFDSLATCVSFLERLLQQSTEIEVELTALWQAGSQVGLFCLQGEIWLERQGKRGRALQATTDMKVVEGKLTDNDTYLLLTRSATVDAAAVLQHLSTETEQLHAAFPKLVSLLQASQLRDRVAVCVVDFQPAVAVQPAASTQPSEVNEPVVPPAQAVVPPHSIARKKRTIRTPRLSRRIWFILGGSLVFLITVFVLYRLFLTSQQRLATGVVEPFRTQLSQITESGDPLTTKEGLEQLRRDIVAQQDSGSHSRLTTQQLATLLSEVDQQLEEYSGRTELQRLPVYFDLQAIRAGFVASEVSGEGNTMILLDKDTQTFVRFNLETKEHQLLPVGQYTNIRDLLVYEQNLYILGDGVYQYPLDQNQEAQRIINEGDSNRNGQLLGGFSQFLYIFNPEKRNIYRYLVEDEKQVSEPVGWMVDKRDIDFEQITAMQVDGEIWLGTNQGQIIRFDKGEQVDFTVTGMSNPFTSTIKLAAPLESDQLYVLEPAQQRVVILNKDGTFIREVSSSSLAAAGHIFVDEARNQVLISAGSIIYQISL